MSKAHKRVRVQWTTTAKNYLKELPKDVQRGLFDKADQLVTCSDPRSAYKPLSGPLKGFYRITFGRFRAIYKVDEETIANEDILVTITVTFIAAAIRKERSREDIYHVAQKMVSMGLVNDHAPKQTPTGAEEKTTVSRRRHSR